MRKFADLHLCPLTRNLEITKRMVSRSSELGYTLVGISLPTNVEKETIRQLQETCDETDIDLAQRVDLAPKTPRELLRDLRRLRRRFEIISVTCSSKAVARQAAKDRRVDILSFSATNLRRRFFDYAEAELASQALSCLEIDMAPLLKLTGVPRIHLLDRLRREVEIAKKFDVPIIISSGTTDEYLLRSPHDYAALASLFDIATSVALRALSENPFSLVERNREKLSPEYLAPGVRVVKRGAANG